MQEHFCTPGLSHSLCSILENKWKGPRRLFNLSFCCAEHFAHAALTTSLMLGLLQAPTTQLECSLVLDRMLHTLEKLLFGCCLLMFTAECWGRMWEHLSSTSLCLGIRVELTEINMHRASSSLGSCYQDMQAALQS